MRWNKAIKILLTTSLCIGLGGWTVWRAGWTAPPVLEDHDDPKVHRFTLPAKTPLQILLQTPLNTAHNQPGDPVEAVISQAMYLGAETLISKNTRFSGSITRLEQPSQGRNGLLQIRFQELIQENGERLPMSSHMRTEHPEHIWGGQITPGTKPVVVTQHVFGIGDYNRVMMRGPRAMGQHVQLLPGERMTLILEQPLTLSKPVLNN